MADKIARDAFLYLEPSAKDDTFAQCVECVFFIPNKERCCIHGPKVKIVAGDSCGFFVPGEPSSDAEPIALVTPKESGLVHRQVRCENCRYLDGEICGLYQDLNELMPEKFVLEAKVNRHGCCNAQMPIASRQSKPSVVLRIFRQGEPTP